MNTGTPNITVNEPNYIEMYVNGVCLGFSYRTCVAFNGPDGFTVRPNDWGPTTGRHMNRFCNDNPSVRHASTVTLAEFQTLLDRALNNQGASV